MTIEFEFELSDEEASDFVYTLHDAIIKSKEMREETGNAAEREWWDGHIAFKEALYRKILAGQTRK